MTPELRAKLLALADEMDQCTYELAGAYGWQLRELVEQATPEPAEPPASPDT